MVLADKPVIEIEYEPVPDPFELDELLIVGEDVLELQQTPRLVTLPPPSLVILPPPVALVVVIDVIVFVFMVGNAIENVLKLITLP